MMAGRAVAALAILLTAPVAVTGPSTPAVEASPGGATFRPGTVLRWAGENLEGCGLGDERFSPIDGACLYPIDLLHPKGTLEVLRWRQGMQETRQVRVGAYDYPVQRLTLPAHMVELSPADLARVRRENAVVARLWKRGGAREFGLPLALPLDPLPRGGRFGHRRVINGQPRSPHGGADYSVPQGTPVLAAADGVVVLVADHFFGGQSVFVDHGDDLVTMYFHLSRTGVQGGQRVARGETLGAVGSTGRATGPHLHFGVRWRQARVDPALLLADAGRLPAID